MASELTCEGFYFDSGRQIGVFGVVVCVCVCVCVSCAFAEVPALPLIVVSAEVAVG